jgi:GNAT superfamily N-acetyltransferase
MPTIKRAQCVDKKGCAFEVGSCAEGDLLCLTEMYDAFSPVPASQGLPPESPAMRTAWVEGMVANGEGFLAWVEGRVVGHAALMPSPSGDRGELVIFVDMGYRDRGIGSELTKAVIKKARSMGMKSLWLTVEMYNFRAISLYKKFGFVFCNGIECERTMTLDLQEAPDAER